ncbi:hypothetical protein HPB47_025303 [Ixodes persulcatus]|uniref:Uncharacterized protein n=1 Tax=Ixodes persulcatus TaxID=34615 RepID=A0AC60Q3N3_IXOPE|nr:hypothetical protein HPB47_025303 [Ixodes persulcatus]
MRQAKDIPKRLSKDQGQERRESLVTGPQRILAGESAKGQAREMPKEPPMQPVQEPLKGASRRHSGPESRDSPTTHVHEIQIQLLGQPVQEQPKDAPGQQLKMVSRASVTEQPKQQPMQTPQVYREQPKKLAQEPDKYIGLPGEQPGAAPKAQPRPQMVQIPEKTLQRFKTVDQEPPKGVSEKSLVRQAKDIHERLSKDQGQERPESLVTGQQKIMAGEPIKVQVSELPKQPPKQPVQEQLKGAPRRYSGPESRDSHKIHVHEIQIQLPGQQAQEQPKGVPGAQLKIVSPVSATDQPKQEPMQPPQVSREQPKELVQESGKYLGVPGEQPGVAPRAQPRPQVVQAPEKTLQRFKPLDQEPPKGVSEKSPMRQAKDIHERLSKDQGQERPDSLVTDQQKIMAGEPTKVQVREMPKQLPKQPVQEQLKGASRRRGVPADRMSSPLPAKDQEAVVSGSAELPPVGDAAQQHPEAQAPLPSASQERRQKGMARKFFIIVNLIVGHINERFGHLLADMNEHRWLTLAKLELCSQRWDPFCRSQSRAHFAEPSSDTERRRSIPDTQYTENRASPPESGKTRSSSKVESSRSRSRPSTASPVVFASNMFSSEEEFNEEEVEEDTRCHQDSPHFSRLGRDCTDLDTLVADIGKIMADVHLDRLAIHWVVLPTDTY